MAGKGVHIFDQLRLARLRRSAAYAAAKGNADTGCLALKRAKNELPVHDAVKSGPIHIGQEFPQKRCDVRHVGNAVRLSTGQCLRGLNQFAVHVRFRGVRINGKFVHICILSVEADLATVFLDR